MLKRGTAAAVLMMLPCGVLPLRSQSHDAAAPGDPTITRLAALVRESSAAGDAALAYARAAEADAAAAVLQVPVTIGLSAEEIPGGARLDRAGSLVAAAEWTAWRGRSARADRAAAAARSAAFPAWRAVLIDAEVGRVIEQVAILTGARLRRERLRAEAGLLGLIEPLLTSRLSTGSASYLEVLRLRAARLQVAAELSRESAQEAAARSAVLGALREGVARDSASGILERMVAAELLEQLAASDSILPPANPRPLIDAILTAARSAADARLAVRSSSLDAAIGIERFGGGDGWTLGPNLGLRLNVPSPFGGGRRLADAAAAGLDAALARLDLAEIQSSGAAGIARGDAAAARERLALLSEAVLDGAPQEREAAIAALRSGRISLIELLDFERSLSRAAMERIDAMTDAATATARARYQALEPYLSIELFGGSAR